MSNKTTNIMNTKQTPAQEINFVYGHQYFGMLTDKEQNTYLKCLKKTFDKYYAPDKRTNFSEFFSQVMRQKYLISSPFIGWASIVDQERNRLYGNWAKIITRLDNSKPEEFKNCPNTGAAFFYMLTEKEQIVWINSMLKANSNSNLPPFEIERGVYGLIFSKFKRDYKDFATFIGRSFTWSDSTTGMEYWRKISERYNQK